MHMPYLAALLIVHYLQDDMHALFVFALQYNRLYEYMRPSSQTDNCLRHLLHLVLY